MSQMPSTTPITTSKRAPAPPHEADELQVPGRTSTGGGTVQPMHACMMVAVLGVGGGTHPPHPPPCRERAADFFGIWGSEEAIFKQEKMGTSHTLWIRPDARFQQRTSIFLTASFHLGPLSF